MLEVLVLKEFLVALALGALIGLEREHARFTKNSTDFAGIRTFPLIALFGALAAHLSLLLSVWLFIGAILILGVLIVASYVTISKQKPEAIGITSEIAALLTFFIGALSYYTDTKLAIVLAIVITLILYLRNFLHHFVKNIKADELASTLKFAVIAFIILPFLPNQGYGPHGIFNPYVTWLMVVFISGIGFFGYILMKWFGERGITLAGILGGLVSSTAVTLSFAERSKKQEKIYKALALGVILANGVMFIRILVEVFVVNRELFNIVLIPIAILALITAGFSYLLYRKITNVKGKVDLGSPFTIGPALKFAAFFAVIIALAKLGNFYFAEKGVYLVSFISGFADVDAITLSLSQLAKSTLAMDVARNGILIAMLTNVGVKGGIAYFFGGKKFGWTIVSLYLVLIALGVAFMFVL